jgi:ribonucleoside-diphosphate reductase alpha chain
MEKMPKDRRMSDVKKLYEYLSQKKINAPTPFSINLGSPKKQYASCCVFTTEDTAASLAAGDHIAYMMTCASAGIGSHLKTRSRGDKVRQGAIQHQGKLPYYKVQQAAVSANLQSSRGGANTMHFSVLDPEIEDLLRLKNVQTVEQKRIKDIDYSVGFNEEFARRVAKNESWMTVSYGDAPELHEAMYGADQSKFVELYAKVEQDDSIPKKFLSARDIALKFLTEAVETGRVYEHNTGEMNRHTPFKDKIYSSNLCQEIGLPTKGYSSVVDLYRESDDGEIGLCSLAAIAAGLVGENEYEDVAYYAALMIDNVVDIMEYPFPNLKYTAQRRRSIGVGITNLAYAMARNGLKYSSLEGKQYIHRLAERHSFWLHKASARLAKERGACEWFDRTRYADGWLPIDTANKEIDKVVQQPLLMPWDEAREDIRLYGTRFSVLEAHMPCESSSAASGHTNSLYMIRNGIIVKTSGTNKNLFIAPEWDTLEGAYEIAWDVPTRDVTEMYAIVQKFTGQAISADYYIKYGKDGKREVSSKQLLQDWLYRVKMGLKTRYYINSATGVDLSQEDQGAECEACKL